jgi:hypothetical protein
MTTQLHLDPVGGISGDMFIGAVLDCWPELSCEISGILTKIGLADCVTASIMPYHDRTLNGSRFTVKLKNSHQHSSHREAHHHTSFREIREMLAQSSLSKGTSTRAIDIFERLANAEGQVHGCLPDDVCFHEVGAWDSIADITLAACLIDALDVDNWSISAIPLGSGRVSCQHGTIPVPAPATQLLLEGFSVFDDGFPGERVTPTGAAILSHLAPSYGGPSTPSKLMGCGIGFGSNLINGLSNILRITQFKVASIDSKREELTTIAFEVDDQSPEDLAVGVENLRHLKGVVDVTQSSVIGKKGRQAMHLQILCSPKYESEIINQCFTETTTLGVRYSRVNRQILCRTETKLDGIRVKTVRRSGTFSAKADIDDVVERSSSHIERQSERARVEIRVVEKKTNRKINE